VEGVLHEDEGLHEDRTSGTDGASHKDIVQVWGFARG